MEGELLEDLKKIHESILSILLANGVISENLKARIDKHAYELQVHDDSIGPRNFIFRASLSKIKSYLGSKKLRKRLKELFSVFKTRQKPEH